VLPFVMLLNFGGKAPLIYHEIDNYVGY